MEVVLKKILSLLPRKDSGELIHGAKKEFAERIGVSPGTVSEWISGKTRSYMDHISTIAAEYDVPLEWLMSSEDDARPEKGRRRGVRIPVYGQVAAGIPIDAITDIEDYEEIPEEMAKTGDFAALRIHGDSMEPRIWDGDVVIIRLQKTAETGDTAIVIIGGDSATCKKIKKTPEGVILIASNPKYEPMFYSNHDIEALPVSIFGRVVEVRGKL